MTTEQLNKRAQAALVFLVTLFGLLSLGLMFFMWRFL
jgi:hypothetical protein